MEWRSKLHDRSLLLIQHIPIGICFATVGRLQAFSMRRHAGEIAFSIVPLQKRLCWNPDLPPATKVIGSHDPFHFAPLGMSKQGCRILLHSKSIRENGKLCRSTTLGFSV